MAETMPCRSWRSRARWRRRGQYPHLHADGLELKRSPRRTPARRAWLGYAAPGWLRKARTAATRRWVSRRCSAAIAPPQCWARSEVRTRPTGLSEWRSPVRLLDPLGDVLDLQGGRGRLRPPPRQPMNGTKPCRPTTARVHARRPTRRRPSPSAQRRPDSTDEDEPTRQPLDSAVKRRRPSRSQALGSRVAIFNQGGFGADRAGSVSTVRAFVLSRPLSVSMHHAWNSPGHHP